MSWRKSLQLAARSGRSSRVRVQPHGFRHQHLGVEESLAAVGSHVFDGIKLPTNAIVIGGAVVTEVAATGPTAVNVSVGDNGNATRYLGATDRVAAGRTSLVPTGFIGGGEDLRITVAPTVAPATAGKISVHVMYIIRNRMTESQTH